MNREAESIRYPEIKTGFKIPDEVLENLNPDYDSTVDFSSQACKDRRLLLFADMMLSNAQEITQQNEDRKSEVIE